MSNNNYDSKQLALFEVEIKPPKSSLTQSVSELQNLDVDMYQTAKRQHIQRYLDKSTFNAIACVNVYVVKRKHKYFRLSYRQGKKIKHIHISGGSIYSELAQHRAKELQKLIDRGAALAEILAALKTFNG